MQPAQYEKAQLVRACWMLAQSNNTDELVAVACTLRNYIVPRFGQVAIYRTYTEVIRQFCINFPTRSEPEINEPALVDPYEGLLYKIESVYDCTMPDITSSHQHPEGAKYFARVTKVEPGSWFDLEIIHKSAFHPLLGSWGAQQFFG